MNTPKRNTFKHHKPVLENSFQVERDPTQESSNLYVNSELPKLEMENNSEKKKMKLEMQAKNPEIDKPENLRAEGTEVFSIL